MGFLLSEWAGMGRGVVVVVVVVVLVVAAAFGAVFLMLKFQDVGWGSGLTLATQGLRSSSFCFQALNPTPKPLNP